MDISGHSSKRFDVVAETRRLRTVDERRAIVAEAMQGRRNASAVARKHGISPSLLFRWKRLYGANVEKPAAPAFVPVALALPPPEPSCGANKTALVEIEVAGGRKLRVDAGIDIGALTRIVAALETR